MTAEIKAIIGLVVIIIVLGAFLAYTKHERSIGEKKVEQADTAAVVVRTQKDAATVAADAEIVADEAKDYAKSTASVVIGAPVISLCVNTPGPVHTAGEARTGPEPNGTAIVRAPDPGVPAERKWDTSPIVQIGHDADAQVKALQDYIGRVCPTL